MRSAAGRERIIEAMRGWRARGMTETRKLAAILVANVVGYSRLARADEERMLARLEGLRSDLIDPAIAAHHGRIVKQTGGRQHHQFRSGGPLRPEYQEGPDSPRRPENIRNIGAACLDADIDFARRAGDRGLA
jgi:hypothetical protein